MIGPSPLRFHAVVAVVALSGALLLADEDAPGAEEVFTFADRTIDESSGLVVRDGLVLTVNDSGSGPVVYAVDPDTGETVGRTTYTSEEVVDVEALAPGPDGSLWVGDIGDNGGQRLSVAVYRLPSGVEEGDRTVEAERYELQYAGGARDAETLLVHPRTGRIYVVSKGLLGGEVFRAPTRLDPERPNTLRPVGQVDGMVTDGAFLPDGRHAVLRTYSTAGVVATGTWRSVGRMPLPDQRQGEGLAVLEGGRRLLLSTEGRRSEVLAVPVPRPLLRAVQPPDPADSPGAGQPPGTEEVTLSEGWSTRTWVAVGLLTAAGLALVGSAVRSRRRARRRTEAPPPPAAQSRSTT